MIVEVEMSAFADGKIRKVKIPDLPGRDTADTRVILEEVFLRGQNEVQPHPSLPSVSMGDTIRLSGKRYLVLAHGFREVPTCFVFPGFNKDPKAGLKLALLEGGTHEGPQGGRSVREARN